MGMPTNCARQDGDRPPQCRSHSRGQPSKHLEEVEFATLEWIHWLTCRLLEPMDDLPAGECEKRYYHQSSPAGGEGHKQPSFCPLLVVQNVEHGSRDVFVEGPIH